MYMFITFSKNPFQFLFHFLERRQKNFRILENSPDPPVLFFFIVGFFAWREKVENTGISNIIFNNVNYEP